MRARPAVLATLVLTALHVADVAWAQEVPGADSKTAGHKQAEHVAYVVAHIDTLMADWRSAWSSGDAAGVAELYAEDALFVPSDAVPVVGRELIRRRYDEALRSAGDIGVSVSDIGVGEEIAYHLGDYRYVDTSGQSTVQVFGHHVTIPMRYGRDWRIRAQFLLPAPDSWRPAPAGPSANLEPLTPDRLGLRTGRTGGGRRSFLQRAFGAASAVLAAWRESWRRDDLPNAVEVFVEEGVLMLPGEEPRFGRASIRARLSDLLPAIGELHSTILDFDASGSLSYAYGRYFCQCRREHGGDVLGHYLSVLTADGATWRIRALFLWAE